MLRSHPATESAVRKSEQIDGFLILTTAFVERGYQGSSEGKLADREAVIDMQRARLAIREAEEAEIEARGACAARHEQTLDIFS